MAQPENDMMRLQATIDSLDSLDPESTIFAAEPWTTESDCIVCKPATGSMTPPEAKGLPYFLEVFIAKELKEDLPGKSPEALCRRIIEYAIKDA